MTKLIYDRKDLLGIDELPPPDDKTMFSIQGVDIPIRTSPLRFAVLYRNYTTSNAWGVRIEKGGDAYIYCRDSMAEQAVSLHASGKQHIRYKPTKVTTKETTLATNKFANQWWEPPGGIATFRLIFPWWGVHLTGEQLKRRRNIWNKNQVLIEGHHRFLTVVSFFILDNDTPFTTKVGAPGFILGELSLDNHRRLVVVANWQPDQGFRELMDRTVSGIVIPNTVLEEVDTTHADEPWGMCITGTSGHPNSVYMVTFPVKRQDKDQQNGDR